MVNNFDAPADEADQVAMARGTVFTGPDLDADHYRLAGFQTDPPGDTEDGREKMKKRHFSPIEETEESENS